MFLCSKFRFSECCTAPRALTRVYPNRGKPTRILTEFWSSVLLFCSVLSWPGAKMPETAEHEFWHSDSQK